MMPTREGLFWLAVSCVPCALVVFACLLALWFGDA